MTSLLEATRAAIDFHSRIPFLVPRSATEPLGDETLSLATSLFAAHLGALAPFADGALPKAVVEPHTRVGSVWSRLGLRVPEASPPRGDAGMPPQVAPPAAPPASPVVMTAPTSPVVLGPSVALPKASASMDAWAKVAAKVWSASVDRLRADPRSRARVSELAAAYGADPKTSDPYLAHQEILSEPFRVARWEHPQRLVSESVPGFVERAHQSAARALESHVLWMAAYDGDASFPSPWWPVLLLWNLGVWPIPAQDGVLLLLAAPVVDGRVPFDPANPKAPWPRLGSRRSPNQGDAWEPLDAHFRFVMQMGLGPLPGEFSVMYGNPPGR